MHQSKSCTVCDYTEQRAGERSPVIVESPNDRPSPSTSSLSELVIINTVFLKYVNYSVLTGGRRLSSSCGFGKRGTIVKHDQRLTCLLGTRCLKRLLLCLRRRQIMWHENEIIKTTAATNTKNEVRNTLLLISIKEMVELLGNTFTFSQKLRLKKIESTLIFVF